jgi:hypothetical protein
MNSDYFIAAAAAGGIAAAAYLDGKYQLRRELNYVLKLKRAEREYARRCTLRCSNRRFYD